MGWEVRLSAPSDRPVELVTPKGLPPDAPADLAAVNQRGWNLFTAGFHWPAAVIIEPILRRNSATMAAYCARHGVSLAPHGKTTMAPDLFDIQLQDGAWAITAATVWQARVMKAAGVPRVLLANEVVSAGEIGWLAEALADPSFEISCYVDSIAGVEILDRVLSAHGIARPLPVLVELGVPEGRTGARSVVEAAAVAAAAGKTATLQVLGTSAFEGIISARGPQSADDRVATLLADLHRLTVMIAETGGFDETPEVVISAGGSMFFDYVVAEFGRVDLGRALRPVLRSGNYLMHADGGYEHSSPMGGDPRLPSSAGRLQAAMEVWGTVVSRPEPTRALVGVGKRDVSPDGSPPVVRGIRTATGEPRPGTATTVALNDQHAYLDVDADDPIAAGDLVAFGVNHGCTTFDKWRAITMVDEAYQVRGVVRTYF